MAQGCQGCPLDAFHGACLRGAPQALLSVVFGARPTGRSVPQRAGSLADERGISVNSALSAFFSDGLFALCPPQGVLQISHRVGVAR